MTFAVRLLRVAVGVGAVLAIPLGLLAGVILALAWTFLFIDADPTGSGDAGAAFSFLALAILLGLAGLGAGGWLCVYGLNRLSQSRPLPDGA